MQGLPHGDCGVLVGESTEFHRTACTMTRSSAIGHLCVAPLGPWSIGKTAVIAALSPSVIPTPTHSAVIPAPSSNIPRNRIVIYPIFHPFHKATTPVTATMVGAITTLPRRARIAITLGDSSGIGPELIAKLLSNPSNRQRADIVLLADKSELESAISDAGGVQIAISADPGPNGIQVLDDNSASQFPSTRGQVSKVSGGRSMHQLRRALKLVQVGEIDGIVFAPLNKSSLKQAGMTEEDELRWFANQLRFEGVTSEINIAGELWTARVTSHIGVEDVAGRITRGATLKAIELLHRLRYV